MRGFSLIELLVVIAIIGVLSAIVVVLLTSPRTKGADASIKANLRTAQNQAEIYYYNSTGGNNSYGPPFGLNQCPTTGTSMFAVDANIQKAISQATAQSGGVVQCVTVPATGTGVTTGYVIQAPLKTGGYWCVDSSGKVKPTAAVLSGSPTACPST
jgi:prepilin-type N-terminal cleavage/methylation domain-containing protein